jgi:dTMP kinase
MKETSSGNSSSARNENHRGRLVTLDGIDGVGKSTQIEQLATFFRSQGHSVILTRDPGGTPVGAKLREILLDSELAMHRRSEAMLFMASRSEMVETIIRPALSRGDIVISDRYLLSNVVYQSVGGEVPAEELWRVGRWAAGGLDPDLTLLLDMPAEESIRRMKGPADRMESRGVDYLESVRQAYLKELPMAGGDFKIVDAGACESVVTTAMIDAVSEWLGGT